MGQSTVERLRAQTEEYYKQYQEQKRLSPKELDLLTNAVIETQVKYIIELETSFARERRDLELKINGLELHLKWANRIVELAIDALKRVTRWRGGKVWVPDERPAVATQEEKEGTDTPGHSDDGPEERARASGEQTPSGRTGAG